MLSEFDDFDNSDVSDRSQSNPVEEEVTSLKSCSTPEDESPSGFGGHQSEDDGYMSMNGRKAKLLLTASSSKEFAETNGNNDVTTPDTPPPLFSRAASRSRNQKSGDFPPPPEEAERIISTLLPRYGIKVCVCVRIALILCGSSDSSEMEFTYIMFAGKQRLRIYRCVAFKVLH